MSINIIRGFTPQHKGRLAQAKRKKPGRGIISNQKGAFGKSPTKRNNSEV